MCGPSSLFYNQNRQSYTSSSSYLSLCLHFPQKNSVFISAFLLTFCLFYSSSDAGELGCKFLLQTSRFGWGKYLEEKALARVCVFCFLQLDLSWLKAPLRRKFDFYLSHMPSGGKPTLIPVPCQTRGKKQAPRVQESPQAKKATESSKPIQCRVLNLFCPTQQFQF